MDRPAVAPLSINSLKRPVQAITGNPANQACGQWTKSGAQEK
jgi:hypothetical protein